MTTTTKKQASAFRQRGFTDQLYGGGPSPTHLKMAERTGQAALDAYRDGLRIGRRERGRST